jgi:hypothetical protein
MLLKKQKVGHMQDARLDLWIEKKLLRRSAGRRLGAPGYTRYTNKALLLLSDIEMPFVIQRRQDLKFEVIVYGFGELADAWEDLGLAICRVLFRVVEGSDWPHEPEPLD